MLFSPLLDVISSNLQGKLSHVQRTRLASIHVYPLKGARGVALGACDVLAGGLRHDRRFMLVDERGVFLSQRSHPRLALVSVRLGRTAMTLVVPQGSRAPAELRVPLSPGPDARFRRGRVQVWSSKVRALLVPGDASTVLSAFLGTPCTLVFMPDDVVRPVDRRFAQRGDRVGFADGFPVLVASAASLAELNAQMPAPLPMDRFRPNLVIEGGAPWEEERFGRVRVGGVVLRLPKQCARCNVTTIDQTTAARGKEPLLTLARTRRVGSQVCFAMNAIPDGPGRVRVGNAVTFTEPLATTA
jgi:uncharacterized protein